MNADGEIDSHPGDQPAIASSHSPLEQGMFVSIRDWTDVFGPLRLIRVLRVAASPVCLFLVAVTLLVWAGGGSILLGDRPAPFGDGHWTQLVGSQKIVSPGQIYAASGDEANRDGGTAAAGYGLTFALWTTLVWMPVAIFLARQGGLLTADRVMEPLVTLFQRSLRRSWAGWIAAGVPVLCAGVLAAVGIPGLACLRLVSGIAVIQDAICLLVSLLAIPIGMLLFGGLIAIPLAIASIANEAHADPLDSLSRGYEALFRRPVHLAAATLTAVLLVCLAYGIAFGVAVAGTATLDWAAAWVGVQASDRARLAGWILPFPDVVGLATSLAMVGGIYLLSRQATSQQQPDDLWMPEPPAPPVLPSVKVD